MNEQSEKRCTKCGVVKPIEQFSKQRQPNGQEGRRSHCKDCIKLSSAAYIQKNSERIKAYQSTYRLANSADVRERDRRRRSQPERRERQAEWSKSWKMRNPEAVKAGFVRSHLKRKYNLTEQEYQQMYQAQGGLCAICSNPEVSGRQLAVDHDHLSGLVRGLLCNRCNVGIGQLGDDISRLESAIAYLRMYQS